MAKKTNEIITFKQHVINCFQIVFWIGVLASCISFTGRYWWVGDILAHARLQYLAFFILCLVVVLASMRKTPFHVFCFLLALSLIVANGYPVAKFMLQAREAPVGLAGTFAPRIMSLNVLTHNRDYAKVVEEIKREDPDVVLLLEINEDWADKLSRMRLRDASGELVPNPLELHSRYPYGTFIPRSHNFGMALMSKTEPIAKKIYQWGEHNLPYIQATFADTHGKTLHIVGAHTLPPMSKEAAQDNHEQFSSVMQLAEKLEGAVAVMGDFNNTPWSHSYHSIMQNSSFRNAAAGSFPFPTWKPKALAGIMIDHIFVKGAPAYSWHTGRCVGSDHRAVIVDVQVEH